MKIIQYEYVYARAEKFGFFVAQKSTAAGQFASARNKEIEL